MTATIQIEIQQDLLEFLARYSQERKVRRDEIIAGALRFLHAEWELEKGYLADNEETLVFAETALPVFSSFVQTAGLGMRHAQNPQTQHVR